MAGSAVVLATARTPFGKLGGALASLDATDLGGRAIQSAIERGAVSPEQVDHVVFGQAVQAGQGQIPSRQAQIKAGIPRSTPSATVNKACASGMCALAIATLTLRTGEADVVVAGGMESMSSSPHLLTGVQHFGRSRNIAAVDAVQFELRSPFTGERMIDEASASAAELGITREELDGFAQRSHARAAAAGERLTQEIVPIQILSPAGDHWVEADEPIRPGTTLEGLAALPPATKDGATHTAGNAPGLNDGACAIVLASSEWAERRDRVPIARVLAYGTVADDFAALTRVPGLAAQQALAKVGMTTADVDLWEINEAFASVVVNSMRMLELDEDRVNVNGGAIALGHPLGASGARIVGALIAELGRRGGGTGCAAICSAGGQGDAIVLEVYPR